MSELSQTEPEIARKLYELINPSDAITFWATPIEAAIIADQMLDAPYFVKDADTGEAPKVSDLEARYNEIWCDAKKISSYAEAYRSFVIGKPSERRLYDEAIKRMTADDAKKFRNEHHASRRSSVNDICKSCWEAGDRIALRHPEPSRDTPNPHVEAPEMDAPHPDDLAVDRFAAAMKAKLAKKRAEGYGGWDNPEECTIEHLSRLLVNHVAKGDPVDIGNLAMMIHQRGASIASVVPEPAEPKLYGPYGYLNGCRALTEDTWVLENDPLENNDEYFSIPLFSKVDVSYPVAVAVSAPQLVRVKALDSIIESLRRHIDRAEQEFGVCSYLNWIKHDLSSLSHLRSALSSPVEGGTEKDVATNKNAAMLELYADSYAGMAKMRDGKVNASDVAYDIRHNMIKQLVAPPSSSTDGPAEIVMGRGLVDVTNISHEGRSGILFRPRSEHIPVGADGQLQAGEYWPIAGDVVIWIENEGGASVIEKYLRAFLPSSPTAAEIEAPRVENGELKAGMLAHRERDDDPEVELEAAAAAAFRQAQSVYRADHDHFPLKSNWQTTDESVRDGWRKIATAAMSRGKLNASKLNENDIANALTPFFEEGYTARDGARAVLRLLLRSRAALQQQGKGK